MSSCRPLNRCTLGACEPSDNVQTARYFRGCLGQELRCVVPFSFWRSPRRSPLRSNRPLTIASGRRSGAKLAKVLAPDGAQNIHQLTPRLWPLSVRPPSVTGARHHELGKVLKQLRAGRR